MSGPHPARPALRAAALAAADASGWLLAFAATLAILVLA